MLDASVRGHFMTSRGCSRSRSTEQQSDQGFLLTSRNSRDRLCHHEFDQDIHPDSDAAFLRRHRSIDRNNFNIGDQVVTSGLFRRFISLMSRSPLLKGSSSVEDAASYGALPNPSPRSQSEDGYADEDDDVRKRGRRRGKNSVVGSTASSVSFGSRRHRHESTSQSSNRVRKASIQGPNLMHVFDPSHSASRGAASSDSLPRTTTSERQDEDEGDEVVSLDGDEDVLDPPDNSPYPQVRASVAATDDTSASINTPRMWILSLLCALLGSATNLFFSLRYPSVAITPVIALVIVHPLGRAWDRLLRLPDDPTETFEYGDRVHVANSRVSETNSSRISRLRLWLAQGRWNGKEHACVSNFQKRASSQCGTKTW